MQAAWQSSFPVWTTWEILHNWFFLQYLMNYCAQEYEHPCAMNN